MNKNVPKLRFKEFSDEWRSTSLGGLFTFKNGLNKEKEFFGKGTPIVNYTDVYRKSELNSKNILGLVEVNDKEKANYSVQKGDVFFTRTSETINEIGITAVVTENVIGTVFSGFVLRARPINNLLNRYFCKYCFSTFSARKEIITKSSYTTRALTSGSLLVGMNIFIPSLQEQEKIADFFTILDNLIEEQDGKVSDLELYKKGMMQKIFSQEIRFKDENGCDYREWINKLGKEIYEVLGGAAFKSKDSRDSGIKWLKIANVGINKTNKEEVSYLKSDILSEYTKYILSEGDLILALTRPILNERLKVALIDSFFEGALLNQRVGKILIDNEITKKFVYYVFQNIETVKYFENKIAGTDPPNLSNIDLLNLPFKLPCLEEQNKIADFLSNIDNLIDEEKKNLDDLREMKKGLLQQIFV